MCQFQQLYHDSEGYVIRCNECRHYQLLFNRIIFSLDEEEYQTFLISIAACKLDLQQDTSQKEIVLATPRRGVHLLLSQGQVAQLYCMLEEADTERKTLSFLQLFEA